MEKFFRKKKEKQIFAFLMDLLKAFGTIHKNLLLTKLHANGFSIIALNLMCSYWKNRKQRVPLNNNLSASNIDVAGVQQQFF